MIQTKPKSVKQFRGLINDSPVVAGLFPFVEPNKKVYLVEVLEFEEESQVTVICDLTQNSVTAFVPNKYLEGLFIPFNTEAAKVLFGSNGSKFD